MASMHSLVESLQRYRDHGIETGSGLRAVLENDLFQTLRRVDPETCELLVPLMRWIEMYLPPHCYGSRAKVDAWIDGKRRELAAQRQEQADA